jgi:hypothetical protein
MYLMYVPFGAWFALTRGSHGLGPLRRVAAFCLGFAVALLPWSAYMTQREGSFVLLSDNSGEVFAGSMNPKLLEIEREENGERSYMTPAGRTYTVSPGKWLNPSETGYLSDRELRLPFKAQGKLLTSRAIAWMKSHPADALYIQFRKLTYMWGIYPFWQGWSRTLLGSVPTLLLLGLASLTMIRLRSRWRELSIFLSLPVFVSLITVVGSGSWRFRMPGDIGLIALISASVLAPELPRTPTSGKPDPAASPV